MNARPNIRLLALPLLLLAGVALAHTVAEGDQDFVRNSTGAQIVPFIYLGAKHMVTGYDHLLFLAGVIFFLYRLKEVALYVTLFAIGHSSTLLLGVLTGLHVNPYLIDAIIGLSVVYKALDNMGAFGTLVRLAAEREARRAGVRVLSRLRARDQAAGTESRARRAGAEHARLQRRRRDRSAARVERDPARR